MLTLWLNYLLCVSTTNPLSHSILAYMEYIGGPTLGALHGQPSKFPLRGNFCLVTTINQLASVLASLEKVLPSCDNPTGFTCRSMEKQRYQMVRSLGALPTDKRKCTPNIKHKLGYKIRIFSSAFIYYSIWPNVKTWYLYKKRNLSLLLLIFLQILMQLVIKMLLWKRHLCNTLTAKPECHLCRVSHIFGNLWGPNGFPLTCVNVIKRYRFNVIVCL